MDLNNSVIFPKSGPAERLEPVSDEEYNKLK